MAQRPYGVWSDGSGPGDAGLSSIWYDLSIGRVVASAELNPFPTPGIERAQGPWRRSRA